MTRTELIAYLEKEESLAFSTETMKVALMAKKISRKAKSGLEFDCLVLNRTPGPDMKADPDLASKIALAPTIDSTDELQAHIEKLILNKARLVTGSRHQVLYKTDKHWSALDICFQDGRFSIYMVDSANDLSKTLDVMKLLADKLPELNVYYTGGPFQRESYSCAFFAYDAACILARIPDLHSQLPRLKRKKGVVNEFISQVASELKDLSRGKIILAAPYLQKIEKVDGYELTSRSLLKALLKVEYLGLEDLAGDALVLMRNIQSYDSYQSWAVMNRKIPGAKAGFSAKATTLSERLERNKVSVDLFGKTSLHNVGINQLAKKVKSNMVALLADMSDEDYVRLCASHNASIEEKLMAESEYVASAAGERPGLS